MHPSHHVDKTYIALVDGILRDTELEPLRHGITLDDGPCQPAICRILSQREAIEVAPAGIPAHTTAVEVIIHEGRKNQVKRMLSAIHHPVIKLHRSTFGPLSLNRVDRGSWRLLDRDEIDLLLHAAKH